MSPSALRRLPLRALRMKTSRRHLVATCLGGVLLVALALTSLVYEHDLRRERARVSSGSEMVATGCGPIEFASVGSGPAVLLVHGAGGGFDQGLGIFQLAGNFLIDV